MGNFIIKGQWESQKQDGRTSSGETHHSRHTRIKETSIRQRIMEARAQKGL
jgi:hypothetical protein